jgi:aspartyl-tRNA(Asn)/glutamyl-tRNA(Gln) amidotransferase subunit C
LKITEQEVRYVADLANLRLTDDEVARMQHDLDEILTHVDTLNEVNTDGVEPMAQVLIDAGDAEAFRADVEHEPLGSDLGLANAPQKGGGYFKVPKVIER